MIDLLGEFELDALAISQELRIRERDVYDHLAHVARSLRGQGRRLIINPPECLKCGYAFEGRSRFTKPGRCPKCRGTRIQSPTYRVE